VDNINTISARLQRSAGEIWAALFRQPTARLGRLAELLLLCVLFASGIFQWGDFLNWGRIPFDQLDWYEITGPRLGFTQSAIRQGVLPLQVDQATGLKNITDRFLAIPDVVLSPQVLLLGVMEPGSFVLADVLFLYSLGFVGLLLLRRRYRLSLAAFGVMYCLFNFNGHIVDHYSLGHFSWGGYFLLPYLALLVLRLFEEPAGWRWIGWVAVWMALAFLQGSFHLVVWVILLLACLGVFYWAHFRQVYLALIFGLGLCAFRIVPSALEAGSLQDSFHSGFASLGDLLEGLVSLKGPQAVNQPISILTPQVIWPEFDHYIGVAGLAFILTFGIYAWLAWEKGAQRRLALFGSLGVVALLSIGRFYQLVFALHVPMLTGERVSSRFLGLVLAFLSVLAAIGLQRWLDRSLERGALGRAAQAAVLAGFLLLAHDLEQHRLLWKVDQLGAYFAPGAPLAPLVPANHPDPAYVAAIIGGAGISLGVLVFLVFKMRKS